MPTELTEAVGDRLRECGQEYGTTPGRPRRCGWFDGVAARYTIRLNGCQSISLTRLDVLDSFESIKICTAYEIDSERIESFPGSRIAMEKAKPIYEEMPGWETDTTQCRDFDELPPAAQRYVHRIEKIIGASAALVSVGPERNQAIIVDPII